MKQEDFYDQLMAKVNLVIDTLIPDTDAAKTNRENQLALELEEANVRYAKLEEDKKQLEVQAAERELRIKNLTDQLNSTK